MEHRLEIVCKKCKEEFCVFCRAGVCTKCKEIDECYFIEYTKAIEESENFYCDLDEENQKDYEE